MGLGNRTPGAHERLMLMPSCVDASFLIAECKMFGSPETGKASDFIALSDDALDKASGGWFTAVGGLPSSNASVPWFLRWPVGLVSFDSWTLLKTRAHSACSPTGEWGV
jgi:hypothetical protein